MRIIGITGGAGSGKSYVAKLICRTYPILHISTDDIARSQMLKGGISYRMVVENFGSDIVGADGEIDRPKLADIVFNDAAKLKLLNSITHPNVTDEVFRIINAADNYGGAAGFDEALQLDVGTEPVSEGAGNTDRPGEEKGYIAALVETAILKEAGYECFCEDIWFVRTPMEDRLRRLIEVRGYSPERARATLASQAEDAEFEAYCTGIIDNPDFCSDSFILEQAERLIFKK